MKVDIISSPQVRKVGSIPKLDRISLKNNSSKQTGDKRVEPVKSENVKLIANNDGGSKVDINKVKSTYTASKSYKSVNSDTTNAVSKENKIKVDTYASYRKKKYAERIKTRFDLFG